MRWDGMGRDERGDGEGSRRREEEGEGGRRALDSTTLTSWVRF